LKHKEQALKQIDKIKSSPFEKLNFLRIFTSKTPVSTPICINDEKLVMLFMPITNE